ncbi:peptidoglycan editing factor PgeF [Gilvimarinus sp. SDUM040013]|uniref:Purine nucleoside phosphorylase n=1 Tax=Gilvimarinus gilvus TaxID=3058038 RepID=A0ABU4S0T5_9GAMM|nr:peptidoglycan editing factor PgeF [Gilvimarinus sp. SDUM040013]MDO3384873.1 peptidoglycan editing factor PgeF [Gilvimarinus sp. SDUM040013]MDX6850702.1 peptidoglycan editing factor PgeF [Gilvimarinus sp. SDUM040013]
MSMDHRFAVPDWPAPANVHAFTTTRVGGASTDGFAANNLALHVGDVASAVMRNRQALVADAGLPCQPQWLEQVHGVKVVEAQSGGRLQTADACFTRTSELPCAVLTADCLPLLLCDTEGAQVAAVHAGWRSLAAGVVRNSLKRFAEGGRASRDQVMAWLGPAIGPNHFEVGVDVLEAFFANAINDQHADAIAGAFKPGEKPMRFMADLYALTKAELYAAGVTQIFGGEFCTYEQADTFYSFRRDGRYTGRMASVIWMD